MTAGHARVEVALGLDGLHCPRCGSVIFNDEVSWDDSPCLHLRFVHDWVGDLWIAPTPPARRPPYLQKIEALLDQDPLPIGEVAAQLPVSCLLLTVVEPARSPNSAGAAVTVGLDFSLTP